MADTPEVIRQQMEETKSQLSDKLVSLEHQVSETVQSTGSAVNATVGAVQETVETVTGAVQDAMKSVSNVFDIGHHINKHPWLVLGGAVVVGYLAVDVLEESTKKTGQRSKSDSPRPSAENGGHRNGTAAVEFCPTVASIPAACESGITNSPWQQLTNAATGALIGIVQDAAARVVPEVMEYLSRSKVLGNPAGSRIPITDTRERHTITSRDEFRSVPNG